MKKEPDPLGVLLITSQSERNLAHVSQETFGDWKNRQGPESSGAGASQTQQGAFGRYAGLVAARGFDFLPMRLHGNTKWLPRCLVCLALCWGWSAARHLTDAFTEAEMFCQGLFQTFVLGTYQGFTGALTRWTPALMQILWPVLHQRMAEIGGRFWRIHGWVPIAFDGSRSTHHEPKPTSGPSVLRTTARGVPPSIARRRARACGEGTINGTSHSHKSRKPGSRCCGTWACACLGRGGWARRIPATRSRDGDDCCGRIPERHVILRRRGLCGISAVVRHPAKRRPFLGARRSQRELVE